MSIKNIAKLEKKYSIINREERNYAALLYSALMDETNLREFLALCKVPIDNINDDLGVYFEYAFLRDFWYSIPDENSNEIKKDIILSNLHVSNIDEISSFGIEEFNRYLGVSNTPSRVHIQFPGTWSIKNFTGNFKDDADFLKICRFKWSFNIKPDIVIHLNNNEAVCIEIKHESGEGSCPSSSQDRKIFGERGIKERIKQTELQEYMMEKLLGLKSYYACIVTKSLKSNSHKTLKWSKVLNNMDLSNLSTFAHEMLNALIQQEKNT